MLLAARHGYPRVAFTSYQKGASSTRNLTYRAALFIRSHPYSTNISHGRIPFSQQPSLILSKPHGQKEHIFILNKASQRSSSSGSDKNPTPDKIGSGTTLPKAEPEARTTGTKVATTRPIVASRLASEAAAATHQLELRLKRVVEELNLGDQLSVIGIAVFTALLLLAPYAAKYMKKHNLEYEIESSDDPVDQLAKLARHEWGVDGSDASDEANSNVVETLLKDVFKSQALQRAAQDFVVQIIQSEQFKSAIGRLVHELWTDLVTDPETLAQVIEVLRRAIQDPAIEKAVQDLVLHVFVEEPQVREALIRTIEKLGHDERVNRAVVALLTESTHTTLNDPEILEHSMEFATDVVGDDIVQRTAGEALRKSVGHAVKPATTVVLSSMGVGLLIFSVLAVGYSRSSEQEAALFESAARSLQSNAAYGIMRIVTWPLRQVNRITEAASRVCPPILEECGALVQKLRGAPTIYLSSARQWLSWGPTSHQLSLAMVSCYQVVLQAVTHAWTGAISWTRSISSLWQREGLR
jgi:hypothetical protein